MSLAIIVQSPYQLWAKCISLLYKWEGDKLSKLRNFSKVTEYKKKDAKSGVWSPSVLLFSEDISALHGVMMLPDKIKCAYP